MILKLLITNKGTNMFSFLFLLTLGGCMTTKMQIEEARKEIGGADCLAKLEEKLKKAHCTHLEIGGGKYEITIRCKKIDKERKNIWDTWWFRLSSSIFEIHPDQVEQVEKHTICIDPQFRIEAYPPEN